MSDTPKDTPKADPARHGRNGGKGRADATPPVPGAAKPPQAEAPAGETVPVAGAEPAASRAPASDPAGTTAGASPGGASTGGAATAGAATAGAASAPSLPVTPKPRPDTGSPPPPRGPATPPPRQPERHDRLALPLAVISGVMALAALGIALVDRGRIDIGRLEMLEQRQAALQPLPEQVQALAGPLSQAGQRLAALEGSLRDGNAVRDQQIQALAAQLAERRGDREAIQRAAEARVAEAERTLSQRIAAAEAALGPRFAAVESAMQQRLANSEAAANERLAARDRELDARFATLQQRESRLSVAERRLATLIASAATESAMAAGRPLGPALSTLPGEAPAALSRYASAAPPTEAALRLSFDDAARAAQARSTPATAGQSVWESAAQRLGNLVTVRRGDEVVWGDAVSGEIETARRALEAGDLAGAVRRIEGLPGPVRTEMEDWLGQARGLIAARAALETLRAGGQG